MRLLVQRNMNSLQLGLITIVFKTNYPYLPDQVEFKHQFVKFKAGHVIYIIKNSFSKGNMKKERGTG